jgi:hypothetical protein
MMFGSSNLMLFRLYSLPQIDIVLLCSGIAEGNSRIKHRRPTPGGFLVNALPELIPQERPSSFPADATEVFINN